MDWSVILVALIAATPGTLIGIATLMQGIRTHSTFNSKMDAMLKITEAAAFARGAKQEKDQAARKAKEPGGG